MLQARAIEPEDSGFLSRRLDFRREEHQSLSQLIDHPHDFLRRDLAGAQPTGQRKSGGVTQPWQHAESARFLVHPENQSLRFVLGDDGDGLRNPVGMMSEQKLEREGRQINTGQPARSSILHETRSARAVCP